MKRWILFGAVITLASTAFFKAYSFHFKAAKLFLEAHEDAFEKMRQRTRSLKDRIDKQVFWCKLRVYPRWVKQCVAVRLRNEMLAELKSLKKDLQSQMRFDKQLAQSDPMTHLIESVVKSMESELERYDLLPVVEAVAQRKT